MWVLLILLVSSGDKIPQQVHSIQGFSTEMSCELARQQVKEAPNVQARCIKQ
jgi:hypothetical protein